MRLLMMLFSTILLMAGCDKIPERGPLELQLISVNGSALLLDQEITVGYDSQVELEFSFASEIGVREFYAKYSTSIFENVGTSDTERLTNEPQAGDLRGEFTYTITPAEQGAPPSGLSLDDRKVLQLVMIDEVGTVTELVIRIIVQ